jgi:hypothetical protein
MGIAKAVDIFKVSAARTVFNAAAAGTRDDGRGWGKMWTMPGYGKCGKPLTGEVYHIYHTPWKTLAGDRVYHIDHITTTIKALRDDLFI